MRGSLYYDSYAEKSLPIPLTTIKTSHPHRITRFWRLLLPTTDLVRNPTIFTEADKRPITKMAGMEIKWNNQLSKRTHSFAFTCRSSYAP
ncbi:hypothetical protein [Mechercharimyces sp. CAU 1602]|uniref:hypothetical protein n=1 Tax=Mechercharimyces sp. CAU 1602 TaxID=2973933 RepID=UPI00216287E7|nr:hypothetical protein [Mechercharimyces sp. CAU 1602]